MQSVDRLWHFHLCFKDVSCIFMHYCLFPSISLLAFTTYCLRFFPLAFFLWRTLNRRCMKWAINFPCLFHLTTSSLALGVYTEELRCWNFLCSDLELSEGMLRGISKHPNAQTPFLYWQRQRETRWRLSKIPQHSLVSKIPQQPQYLTVGSSTLSGISHEKNGNFRPLMKPVQ